MMLLRSLELKVTSYTMAVSDMNGFALCQTNPIYCSSYPSGGSGPASNTWFLGTTRVCPPISISIGSDVFARLINVINREITLAEAIGNV